MKVRIFIVTYRDDFPWLKYLLRSLEKYAEGFSGITIVSDYISSEDTIPEDTLNVVKSIPLDVFYVKPPDNTPWLSEEWGPARPGYYWQQWLKLSCFDYCNEDICMQIDSDCILKSKLTPEDLQSKAGKWYWNFRPWSSIPEPRWKLYTDKMIGMETVNQGMMDRTFIFTRDVTKRLLEYCGKQFDLQELTWEYISGNKIKFSEYCMYGSFIELIDKSPAYEVRVFSSAMEYRGIKEQFSVKYWSYGGMTEAIKKEYESYLE